MERPCHQLPPTLLASTGRGQSRRIGWRRSKRRSPTWCRASTRRRALRVRATIEGIVAVAGVQFGALALWWVSPSYGRALAVGAGMVQMALGLRWASLHVHRRELCLELVIAGRERLPLAAVARERRRLDDPRRQAQLATSLEHLAAIAVQRRLPRERQRPIYNPRVLAAVEPQLRDVAARLRDGGVDLRGVALLDRLLTSGTSPLYGERACSLRDELARGRYLLA